MPVLVALAVRFNNLIDFGVHLVADGIQLGDDVGGFFCHKRAVKCAQTFETIYLSLIHI